MGKNNKAKILILDIETAPILSYTWGIWDQNIGLNQIKKDWHIMSWAAKWMNDPKSKIIYADQRRSKNIEDDFGTLKKMWKLLDEADIVIAHNGDKFDIKKLNARFILNGMKPPSSYKQIDTLKLARKKFKFTSNRLSYLTNKLCTKYKKLNHPNFTGFELWKECIAGNLKAWKEMEKYNKYDVLSLEELYKVLEPWTNPINYNLYTDTEDTMCGCGSKNFTKNGHAYTSIGKYQRYACSDCGAEIRGNSNLLDKSKRKSLKRQVK